MACTKVICALCCRCQRHDVPLSSTSDGCRNMVCGSVLRPCCGSLETMMHTGNKFASGVHCFKCVRSKSARIIFNYRRKSSAAHLSDFFVRVVSDVHWKCEKMLGRQQKDSVVHL